MLIKQNLIHIINKDGDFIKTFLFEQYGYYPKEFENDMFVVDNFLFKLLKIDLDEEKILEMEKYMLVIRENFNNMGPHVIKNKFDKYVSNLIGDKYILISIYISNFSLKQLYRFHDLFFTPGEYVELDKILNVWKNRVENIEKNINTYINVEGVSYKDNLKKIMFCIGLATNAMQYLSDIINDYGSRLYGVTLTHKRLKGLDSFEVLNPLNYIVDTPCKDIVMLYQNDKIDVDDLDDSIKRYNLDVKCARFIMSRIMYKCDFFDNLENKKELGINRSLDFDIEKEMGKIKKAYSLLKSKYDIRPIDWLEG